MPAMTMNASGLVFNFLAAQGSDNIFLFKLPITMEEVLETEGVNGRRWRTKFEQIEPQPIDTIAESLNFTTAVALAQEHRSLKGTLVNIMWIAGGSTYSFRNAHISAVVARPIQGVVTGGGASSSSTCHVRTSWIIEPTDFHVFAT